MKKSFKKAIACLLAVLMVAFSMPFSALAAPGDYEPDLQLQFSTFYDADEGEPGSKSATSSTCYQYSGLSAFPIKYDAVNGTLKATKEDINAYNEYYETDPVDEDWNLGVGDVFAVTIRLDNVDIAASGNFNIRFSDNLTPAGLGSYTYKEGKKEKTGYSIFNENNKPEGYSSDIVGFRKPVSDWSASSLYEGMNDTILGDLSCIQEDPTAVDGDGWNDLMMTATLVCQGDHIDVSSVDSALGFFDIKNGTMDEENGYTYPNEFIMATFVFEITGDGPVKFALQDPDGTKDPKLNGAVYFAKKSETLDVEAATTYAHNTYIRETDSQGGDTEWPGSMKMTFMGENTNRVDITFKNADGTVIESKTYAKGAEITAPELPATVVTDDTHTTYAWDSEVQATAQEAATYQVVATTENHNFTDGKVTKHASCSEEGEMTFTCSCGKTKIEKIAKDAHTPGEAVRENEVPATCKAEGSYDEVIYCTVCNAELSRTTKIIDMLDHTPAAAVRENEVPATCTATGSYDEVVYCSECSDELSRETKTIDKIDHTPAAAVRENEVPATCTATGSYDEVVYCSECSAELSREAKTIDKIDHTYSSVVTAPTCTAKGYTTYTCSECGDTYVGDYTDKIAHKSDKGTVTKKATYTATGVKTYKCTECGKVLKTETIAKLPKKTNPIVAKGKTVSIKASAVKKKAQSITKAKAFSVTKAQGKVTFKKSSGNSKITVSSAGKITVKKGLKKGTYKVKVKVKAAGNTTYKSATKTVTVTIKVK
ncbi:MAG: hypothetical protein IJR70_00950 [Eubacterium sp.]|nr:hypothetical protein [Eubacterium sp.]